MSDFDRNATFRYGGTAARAGAAVDQGLRSYMLGVYNNMVLGLAITGLAALGTNMLAVTRDPAEAAARFHSMYLTSFGVAIYGSPLRYVVMLAPLAVMGLSLSSILLVYTGQSVALAFFETAAAFGALSLYGYTTRRDLTPIGSFLVMGLFGLIIVSLVNLFMQSSALQFGISILAVGIFAGLTAWDTQRIKEMYFASDSLEVATKKSVNGALMLYLDFINIFTALIQLTGSRNN